MGQGPSEEVRFLQLRVNPKAADVVETEAKAEGKPIGHVLRRIVENHATLYGLPRSQVEVLDADRKALRMDRETYFKELLDHRYRVVLQSGLGAAGPGLALPTQATPSGGKKK